LCTFVHRVSQKQIYDILKELDGAAFESEIKCAVKQKYPNFSLYKYVGNTLRKMESWHYVECDRKKNRKDPFYRLTGEEFIFNLRT
jgi:DNA-binding PadR family transcriptional regulator